MDLSLFLPPLAACLVIVAIHSYLGLHVIAREVIFVDLSLAQMAALGSTVAILAGSQSDSTAALIYALGFTTLGAAVFALTRSDEGGRVPQEAIIGIVYVVASAAAILVADRTPRGGEAIKDILVGSLLWVTWPTIIRLAGIYLVLGLFHWVLRKRFLTISFQPATALANGWSIRWWDSCSISPSAS
jgi:zinc/manganese transport system permease protein